MIRVVSKRRAEGRGPPNLVTRLVLFVLLAFGFSHSSRSGIVGPDAAGYSADDSVPFDFQDISGTGLNVGAADETTHGPFPLGFSFRLYGAERSHVFLSSNGWLSFSDPGVPGGADASNDCPLPNSNGQDNLIAGIWDDLDPTAPGAGIYRQSFGVGECPYGDYPGACFIAQWNDVVHFADPEGSGTDDLTFEIILLDNDEILVQIEDAGDEAGSGSTTGIESAAGSVGLDCACNSPNSISDNTAILFVRTPSILSILYVNDDAVGSNDGSSWTDAFNDLQDALAIANLGDQIWVAEGIYVPGATVTDSFELLNGVDLLGGFEAAPGMEGDMSLRDPGKFITVLSGDIDGNDVSNGNGVLVDGNDIVGVNSEHVLTCTSGVSMAVLDGFTITAGSAIDGEDGGGMFNLGGSPSLSNLVFSGNRASVGGGLNTRGGGNPSINNLVFSGNFATEGGGLFVASNDAILMNVGFFGNAAVDGGGIRTQDGFPMLINAVFSGNFAGLNGGAIYFNGSTVTMTNTTLFDNSAGDLGDGIFVDSSTVLTLQNSILWNNGLPTTAPEASQVAVEPGGFASLSFCLSEGGCPISANCSNLIEEDPRFVDADDDDIRGTLDDDLRILLGSPAIDVGNNDADLDGPLSGVATISSVETDLGGNPRIQNGIVDLGAFESPPTPSILYVDDDANGAGFGWTDAFTDLQSALIASASGMQIWVAAGVYVPGGTESDTFQLKNGVEIYGGFEGLPGTEDDFSARDPETFLTILSGDIGGDDITDSKAVVTDPANIVGQNSDHIVNGSEVDATAVLDGFTITAGQADGEGLEDAVGGGAFIFQGSPTLANLAFSGNTAVAGGGVVITNDSFPTLTDVTIIANSATVGTGGGLFVAARSDPVLRNFRILGNTAADDGGGMYNFNDSGPRLINGIFSGNTAMGQYGGGMLNEDSSPNLTNVSFGGNNSGQAGGGMFNTAGSSPTIQNSIFWGNTGGVSTRGIFNDEPEDSPVITNCILEGGCDEFVDTCANAIDMDPLFVDPNGADNEPGTLDDDLRLMAGSPAINSGSNTADLDGFGGNSTTIADILFDLDGLFRIAEGTVDMGPYEFGSAGPSPTPTITSTPTQTSTPTDTPTITNTPVATETHTLTETVTATPTFAPTSSATPSPIVTRNYDVQPQPVVDGQINSLDLLHWFGEIKEGNETGDLLFDFSRFWQESP